MELKGWLVLLGLFIIGMILFFFFTPALAQKLTATAAGPFDLSSTEERISVTQATPFYNHEEASFQAFVYLNSTNKTGTYAPCGTNENQASCETGRFIHCKCDPTNNDCGRCKHDGYKAVFTIVGLIRLEVLTTPDASRPQQSTAQITIETEGPPVSGFTKSAKQTYVETLTLPPLPFQKWTMVTVARQGRRFDIYYNDQLVLSQKTSYMPRRVAAGGISSGSPGLGGQISLLNVYNYALDPQKVAGLYSSQSDTRGTPFGDTKAFTLSFRDPVGIVPSQNQTFLGTLQRMTNVQGICPPSGCINPPAIRPASPFYDWSTNYG